MGACDSKKKSTDNQIDSDGKHLGRQKTLDTGYYGSVRRSSETILPSQFEVVPPPA